MKTRIGLIGVGNIAQNAHIPAYLQQPDAQLVAVYDIKGERAREVADKYHIPHVCSSLEELVSLPDLDAVSICVWNNGHAEAAIAAAKAGKHVLCEKPMAMTVAECQAMEQAAREAGVVFMMGFVNRFRQDSLALKEIIDQGRLGQVYMGRCQLLRRRGTPLGWFTDKRKSGGGPVIDIGVHAIDLCWYLMGRPKPIAVCADTHSYIGDYQTKGVDRWRALDTDDLVFNVEDSAAGMIRFEGGASLHFAVSWALNGKAEPDILASVYGTEAGIDLCPATIYGEEAGYLTDTQPVIPGMTPYGGTFEREIRHFLDCVQQGKQPICPAADGLAVQRMLCGIYESAAKGGEIRL